MVLREMEISRVLLALHSEQIVAINKIMQHG